MPSTEGLVQQLDNLKPGLQRAVTAAAAVAQAGHLAGMAGRVLAPTAFKGSASPLLCNEESGSGAGASHGLLACDSQLVQALQRKEPSMRSAFAPAPQVGTGKSSRSSTVVMSDHALPCTQAESVLSGQAMCRRGLQGSLMYLHGGVAAHEHCTLCHAANRVIALWRALLKGVHARHPPQPAALSPAALPASAATTL